MDTPDLLKAFMQLRFAFRKENLEPPTAIVLKDAEQASRFMAVIWKWPYEMRHYVDEDLPMMTAVKVLGIEVRWETKKYLLPNGETALF